MNYETFKTNYQNKIQTITNKYVLNDYKKMFLKIDENISIENPEYIFEMYFRNRKYVLGTCAKHFSYFNTCLNSNKDLHTVFCNYARELKNRASILSKKRQELKKEYYDLIKDYIEKDYTKRT
jgi:hypothetical protein